MRRKDILRLGALLSAVLLLLLSLLPTAVLAEAEHGRLVRVGFYPSVFSYRNQAGKLVGYGYDYQQTIAAYTGWEYEYVEGSWSELLTMLENGEIDLLADVSMLPGRADRMLFSADPMGVERYYLYVRESDTRFSAAGIEALAGRRVAVTSNSYEAELLRAWLEAQGLRVELLELSGDEEMAEWLEQGRVDAVLGADAFNGFTPCTPILEVGYSDIYFAVSKQKPALKAELDAAMGEILIAYPNYHDTLYRRYQMTGRNRRLSSAESTWLEGHGAIRIGYREDYLAFCGTDENGEWTGALRDILTAGAAELPDAPIRFEAIPYPNTQAALDALQAGELDCVFPVSMGGYDAEQQGLFVTNEVVNAGTYVAVRNERFNGNEKTIIAKNAGNPNYDHFISMYYPGWQVKEFKDTQACLEAIAAGEADCIFLTTYRVSNVEERIRSLGLTTVYMDREFPMAIAVRRQDRCLLSVLNKLLSLVPSAVSTAALAEYSYVEKRVSFMDYLSSNLRTVLIAFGSVLTLILLLLVIALIANRRTRRAELRLSESNVELVHANEEQARQLLEIRRLNELFRETQDHAIRALLDLVIRPGEDEDTISAVLTTVCAYYGASRAYVFERDETGAYMVMTAGRGSDGTALSGERLPMDRLVPWLEQLCEQGCSYCTEDMDGRPLAETRGMESVLAAPIQSTGETIGFLSVDNPTLHREHELYLSVAAAAVNHELRVRAELAQEERHRRELEASREAAEAANRAKTTFLNNMSHDIRTPMNAILGFAARMEKELDDPERMREHLGRIRSSGEYLLSLINDVLEVARIDSGKETLDESFVDLYDPACDVSLLLEEELARKHQQLSRSMDITHRYIFADIHKIRQITMNLLSNAVKYTPEGGSIALRFEEVPSEREGYATYRNIISDTGIGMSEEFRKHLFELFSRERSTTESRVVGTGLGMSIVKKLTELMGGTIEVESEPGKGSRFIVTLSHRIVEDPDMYLKRHEPAQQADVELSGRRILLAEDNDLNAEIATAVLEDLGIAVDRAEDGVVCVDRLLHAEPGTYDLILMDIQMPNLNGYDATRRIRMLDDPARAGIPIVAMTANAFEEDRRRALEAGMDDHLAKPIDLKRLTETLARLIGRV